RVVRRRGAGGRERRSRCCRTRSLGDGRVGDRLGRLTWGRGMDPDRVIEKETDVGTIWLQKDAELFTPDVLRDGYWAQEITERMRKALRSGMTFVDAGANIGYFSVLGSNLVGPSGRVFCVEPDPLNLEILRANLERNSCDNATVLPVAAWKERTTL